MNRRTSIIALVGTLFAGLVAGALLTKWSGGDASPAAPGERKVLYWHDPMVPGVRFDKPGKSPYMDMQLVPVYADVENDAASADVRVDTNVTQNLGVRLGKVERAALAGKLTAVGTVAFDEDLLEVVQSRVAGYVQRLHVKTSLQAVKRGQPLAELVAPAWISAQEEYLSLLGAESERGREIRAAARERLVVLGVPERVIQRLESTRKVESATTLYAPIDGVVTELGAREGAAVAEGSPLFRINALRKVWAVAQVPEVQMSGVAPGARVIVTAAARAGESFAGRVVAILPDLDASTRTLPVRVEIDNPRRELVPGMFVSLEFAASQEQARLVVPSEAVIYTGTRSVVVVSRGEAGFDVKEVRVGAESGGMSVIESGLEEGESIVLSGQFLIDSEASLKSTISRLAPADAATRAGESAIAEPHDHGAHP